MKKGIKFIFFIGLILIFFFIYLGFYLKFKTNQRIIRIGYQPYVVGHSNIILVLKRLKLLEEKGYKVNYIPFLSGPPLNEALIGKRIDVGFAGDLPTISLLASNTNVKILAVNNKSLRQAILIDEEKTSKIKNVSDLRNKKIALVKGSSSHFFLFKALIENGIDPESVILIHMDVPNQPLALITNQVDAIATWEPWPTKIEREKIGRIIKKGNYSGYIFAREDFIKNNPIVIQDIIEGFQKALEFCQKNLYQTSLWVSEETGENPEIIYDAVKTDKIFEIGENIKPTAELITELNKAAQFMFAEGLIPQIPNFNEKFDLTFVNKILENQ